MIEFPIYNLENKRSLTIEVLILVSSVVILYLLFPTMNPGVLLLPVIVYIVYKAKIDRNKMIGKIYLTGHQIRVESESNDFQINFSDIDKFVLTYSGYQGQRLRGDFIGPINTFSGIDNYITIVKDDTCFKCRFQVENLNEEQELVGLVENWANRGYDISNIRINQ